ncbi:hypothetical protein GOV08_00840 [Candidatus Woesearchaeota archaeon]|nr:hypothetical protein [Candidatus Woesearchaeota archaeon]
MKHTAKVTIVLLSIFLISQAFGLFALNLDLEVVKDEVTGKVISANYSDTAIGERPDVDSKTAFFYIIFAVVFGTSLLLLLIHFKQVKIWKAWFFLAVFLTMAVTIEVFISSFAAYLLAFALAVYKIYRTNFYVQNISEILMYTGIAILFVPILNVFWMAMLLLAISAYDAYAVWKSKHMIKMANFQTEAKLFAGLTIPYKHHKDTHKSEIKVSIPKAADFKAVEKQERVAILGGGDIAFPLLFSGTVMQSLIIDNSISKPIALLLTLIITVFVTFALSFLLTYGKKDKFYPAMPFLSAGCFIGYGIIYLLLFLIY